MHSFVRVLNGQTQAFVTRKGGRLIVAVVMVSVLILIAVTGGVLIDQPEKGATRQSRGELTRSIAYWLFTVYRGLSPF